MSPEQKIQELSPNQDVVPETPPPDDCIDTGTFVLLSLIEHRRTESHADRTTFSQISLRHALSSQISTPAHESSENMARTTIPVDTSVTATRLEVLNHVDMYE